MELLHGAHWTSAVRLHAYAVYVPAPHAAEHGVHVGPAVGVHALRYWPAVQLGPVVAHGAQAPPAASVNPALHWVAHDPGR